ncbi:MAG TPA: HD domain-containing protein [Spirochaetota bacterium]|nr:HD domain-containing protein [Spirochaetota bacterium]HPI90649.1 HD domain-containing protein [Spirochaetota bacterium]HPR49699.1 HD domain-containing protein [Spirochaetota bacterium]
MTYSYNQLRHETRLISEKFGKPRFYRDLRDELDRAASVAESSAMVRMARDAIAGSGDSLGHGFYHARMVAIESGAIVFSEAGTGPDRDWLAELVMAAGFLHDIRRNEKDHPAKGADEARRILAGTLDARDLDIITFAIRNHEAFKEPEFSDEHPYMLIASSLYDADKFRWGPDNFVHTLWDMAESMNAAPEMILRFYDRGIESIVKIRDSFRTATGRTYGPEFIDIGLLISEEVRKMLAKCS